MANESLARRYAKAFLEVATEHNVVDRVGDELIAFVDSLSGSRDLQIALQNPAIDRAARNDLLQEVLKRLGASEQTRRYVGVLSERDRLGIVEEVAQAYRAMADEKARRVRCEVTSAEPLDEGRLAKIRQALEAVTGRRVVVQLREDPELLAGVVTKVGSWVYDGSLRTQLQRLHDTLRSG